MKGSAMEHTYAVIAEATETGYSAYVPDLPGCVATGATLAELQTNMQVAITMHLDGLRADGEAVPLPRTQVLILAAA